MKNEIQLEIILLELTIIKTPQKSSCILKRWWPWQEKRGLPVSFIHQAVTKNDMWGPVFFWDRFRAISGWCRVDAGWKQKAFKSTKHVPKIPHISVHHHTHWSNLHSFTTLCYRWSSASTATGWSHRHRLPGRKTGCGEGPQMAPKMAALHLRFKAATQGGNEFSNYFGWWGN